MQYKYETTTLEGFVQRVATQLLTHGYYFFAQGVVPNHVRVEALDQKLLEKYDVVKTEGQRAWRKRCGLGNVQYVRFGRAWVLLATHGSHPIRDGEALRDIRDVPIQLGGYSIYVKRGNFLKGSSKDGVVLLDGRYRVRVLISRSRYRELVAYFLDRACHLSVENLAQEFWRVPFEPYAPIRKQLLKLLKLVNAKRQSAGYSKIPPTVIRFRRRIVKAFESPMKEERAA